MDNTYFTKSGICSKKVDEIINNSILDDGKIAVRFIKHDSSTSLGPNDFMPSFIERNNGVIPTDEQQSSKGIKNFGVSVFDSIENAIAFQEFVPPFRDDYIAIGKVDALKGSVGIFDINGHYQYFLFDPFDNNPCIDFDYYDKKE